MDFLFFQMFNLIIQFTKFLILRLSSSFNSCCNNCPSICHSTFSSFSPADCSFILMLLYPGPLAHRHFPWSTAGILQYIPAFLWQWSYLQYGTAPDFWCPAAEPALQLLLLCCGAFHKAWIYPCHRICKKLRLKASLPLEHTAGTFRYRAHPQDMPIPDYHP